MSHDRDKLRHAFTEFRAIGYWARTNQDDGWAAVPEDVLRRQGKVVFWHANETEFAFDEAGDLKADLHIHHFSRDTDEVARVLEQHGLHVRVDMTFSNPVVVVTNTPVPKRVLAAATEDWLWRNFTLQPRTTIPFLITVSAYDSDAGMLRLIVDAFPNTWVTMPVATFKKGIATGIINER